MNVTKTKIVCAEISADTFVNALMEFSTSENQQNAKRFFKTGIGEYGEGDLFIGVRNGPVNALAKAYINLPLCEIEKLLKNPIHEVRSGALGIMDYQARRKMTSESRRNELFDLYFKNHQYINNWDLVDKAAPSIVGGYLFNKERDILLKIVQSKNLWERRTAIVSTLFFIRQNDIRFTFILANLLLNDHHDLIHKATGWMLRSAGDKNKKALLQFLDTTADRMPRTMLRYCLEHLSNQERTYYMALKKTKMNSME